MSATNELQYADAAQIFAGLHPAAAAITGSYQGHAIQAVVQGKPRTTPAQIWAQIGAEPGARLFANWRSDPEEWATPAGLAAAWKHLDTLAATRKLDMARYEELVTEARDVLAAASRRSAPVVLSKTYASWQVLFHKVSPLTGERWADLPVHSVVRTSQLRAGHGWDVVDARLDAEGLTRYGFRCWSAGDALLRARRRWETRSDSAYWAYVDAGTPTA